MSRTEDTRTEDTALGLRARKKLHTRQSIERAALELFERDGFGATTVDEIAEAAEISPRTFFHYFPSKEDAALADHADRLERIVEALAERPSDEPPWRAIREAFLVVAADYEIERERLLRRFRVMLTTPSVAARSLQLQAGWEDAVARAVAEHLGVDVDVDVRCRLVAGAALAALRAAMRQWFLSGGSGRLPGLVEANFDLLAEGLGEID